MSLATCLDCRSTHPHGAREFTPDDHLTTTCPSCGSPQYVSEPRGDGLSSDDIRTLLESTYGVGEQNLAALDAHVGTLTMVPCMTVEQLTEVEGIGEQTARNIVANC